MEEKNGKGGEWVWMEVKENDQGRTGMDGSKEWRERRAGMDGSGVE